MFCADSREPRRAFEVARRVRPLHVDDACEPGKSSARKEGHPRDRSTVEGGAGEGGVRITTAWGRRGGVAADKLEAARCKGYAQLVVSPHDHDRVGCARWELEWYRDIGDGLRSLGKLADSLVHACVAVRARVGILKPRVAGGRAERGHHSAEDDERGTEKLP